DNVSVSADITVDSTTKIASEGFVMKDGASVRYKDNDGDNQSDEAGIRWTTEVSDEFAEYLSTGEYEGASVEYRTLITAVNQLGGADVTTMTVENAEALLCNDTKGTLAKGEYHGSVLYKDDTVEGWADLTAAQLRVIYEAELVARSYVKVTKADNSVEYIYAQTGDTARSMRAVANAALMKGENSLLSDYVGTATTQEERAGLYNPETDNGNVALELNELGDGTYVAYVGAKRVGEVAVANNAATMSVNGVADGEQNVSLFDTNANVYRAPIIKATKVIDEAEDLAMFNLNNAYVEDVNNVTTVFDGYYILGNDIDASENGYTHKSIGYTDMTTAYTDVGLTGTFNGDGYKISNLTFAGNANQYNEADGTSGFQYKSMDYSLFGIVCGGTIKNVGFVNVSYNVTTGINTAERATLATQLRGATLENVYIQVSGLGFGQGSFNSVPSGVAGSINDKTVMTNCIFDIYDDGTVQTEADRTHANGEFYYIAKGFGALSADGGKYIDSSYSDVTDREWTNVYVVSPLALSHEAQNNVHWEWYGSNLNKTESTTAHNFVKYENVIQYLSHDDMIAANIDYEALGFTADKGWKIVDGYVPTWKGVALDKTVNYTVNLDDEKTQLSEDDLYALFGDKTATLVSASTSDSTYGISYTGGALSVTGAAWNGETFTAVFSDGNFNVTATVRLCTEVITTAEELGVFCLDNTDYDTLYAHSTDSSLDTNGRLNAQVPTKVINGYYVLGSDIDASETTWTMPTQGYIGSTYRELMEYRGFQGTFDGCGYTISNLTFGGIVDTTKTDTANDGDYWKNNSYSLFGIIGKDATVKNLALTNIKYVLNFAGKAETKAICAGIASYVVEGATVENVYVSVEGVTGGGNATYCTFATFAYAVSATANLNNVVVSCENLNATTLAYTNYGSFVGRKHSDDNNTEISTDNWNNIYVISSQRLYASSSSANNTLYAANEGQTGVDVVAGLYKYADMDAWKQAQESDSTKNDFSSFNGVACWDLTTGVPVWKN
ncbi:MAG: hypothetical protein IJA89_09050, partial [Clostridia bacterium]|nr:hypothetical protein [Clostridia bacterium]